jgi:PAS domain S-box-containing protein
VKIPRPLLLMFVFPVLLMLALAVLLNRYGIHRQQQQLEAALHLQNSELTLLAQSANSSAQLAQIHLGINSALDESLNSKLSAAALYRAMSGAVNSLALLREQLSVPANGTNLDDTLRAALQQRQTQFEKYREFVQTTADIAAVEPEAATRYLAQAQAQYNEFTRVAYRLDALLAERTQQHNAGGRNLFQPLQAKISLWGALGLLGILLLSLYFALLLTRRVNAVHEALTSLAKPATVSSELPAIERMYSHSSGEFKNIATALLELRLALLQRGKAEKGLRESEAKAQQALGESRLYKLALDEHCQICICNAEGNITQVNANFCAASGYTQQELLGNNPHLLKSTQHNAEFFRAMYDTLNSGSTWHGELCNLSKSGTNYWLASHIIPLPDKAGKTQQYLAVSTDISAYKTDTGAPHIFVQAAAQNPCSLVISNLAGRIEYVNTAFSSLSGYSSGEALGQAQHFCASLKTSQHIFLSAKAAGREGQTWQGEMLQQRKDGSEYPALCSITPLLQNDGRITHYLTQMTDISAQLHSDEKHSRVRLQLQEQLHNCNTQLAAAQAALSAAQAGAQEVPPDTPDPLPHTLLPLLDALQQHAAHGAHILLADSEASHLHLLQNLLQEAGLQVDCASTGIQALEMAQNRDYHLIIMALRMPGMDGQEVTRHIRIMPGRTITPILGLLSQDADAEHISWKAAGMNDFVRLPVEAEQLYSVVLNWLAAG